MSKTKSQRKRKRKPSNKEWMGNLLLEVVALIAVLFMLLVTSGEKTASHETIEAPHRTSNFGAAIVGYISDHFDRQFADKSL